MPQKQKIAPDEKVKVVRKFLNGTIGQAEASKLLSVSTSTFRKWIVQYQSEGVHATPIAGGLRILSLEIYGFQGAVSIFYVGSLSIIYF